MKIDLISFQDKAVKQLRLDLADACDSYNKRGKTQVVSLQAPTGAGKTIIAAALIESIYFGTTLADGTVFAEQPEAIFVWLSDSPELNEQSKQKIEFKTSKLRFGQCETISEDSFNREMLEDGKIYFLNIQKISKNGNLTKPGENRQYTIWETLDNTIANKSDHLYFIIDEAHRGAKSKKQSGTDTTIMQRFIKGYEYVENGVKRTMRPMPVILGISATAHRFNTLISNITNVGLQTDIITADNVRSSGLLKDRIVITYPDDDTKNNDMVLLDAAIEEWLKKRTRWYQYTYEQHYANVDPVLVVQVCKGTGSALSDTNLDDVLAKIESKCGTVFKRGEVVHCFGESSKVVINGLEIPHVNASDIAEDHIIKVVLFKEALSTGWDCPRAETMMSFAAKKDPTYIAQLLGRMVRTPLQKRVSRDEFLNDVKLYLPHFDKENVKAVIDELQSNEGGDIPTEINGESLAEPTYVTYTVHVKHPKTPPQNPNQLTFDDIEKYTTTGETSETSTTSAQVPASANQSNTETTRPANTGESAPEYVPPMTVTIPALNTDSEPLVKEDIITGEQLTFEHTFDRVEVVDFINSQGYLTYFVRHDRINDYLKSLLDLATLLTHNLIYQNARDEVVDDIIEMIHDFVSDLHKTGEYNVLATQVLEFKLSVQVFDAFGNVIKDDYNDLTLFSDNDLDRQVRNANAKLGKYGFPNIYGGRYYDEENPSAHKIDCILFATDDNCREKLGLYAKNKLNEFVSKYRLAIVNKSDACKKKYHDILADSDIVSEQIFEIPENIVIREDADGTEYKKHLLANEETGIAKIKLNGWETELIQKESVQSEFVCWLRNPAKSWGLCLPYDKNGAKHGFYPDFLIVREVPSIGYVVDVIEPHGNQYADNVAKAKALAEYAKKEDRLGRIQLVHKSTTSGGSKFIRLDLTDRDVREKVLLVNTDDELNNIFTSSGIID